VKTILIPVRLFDAGSAEEAEEHYRQLLERAVQLDEAYLRAHPDTAGVRDSPVRYEVSLFGSFFDIPTALARGWGDADTLACWRAAELRAKGESASAVLVQVPRPEWRGGGVSYTCRVRRGDGSIEDIVEVIRRRSLV